jgi:hypothetical protein
MALLLQGLRNIAKREPLIPEVGGLKVEPPRTARWSAFSALGQPRDPQFAEVKGDSFSMFGAPYVKSIPDQVIRIEILSADFALWPCDSVRSWKVDGETFVLIDRLGFELEPRSSDLNFEVERLGCHYLEKPELPDLAFGEGSG